MHIRSLKASTTHFVCLDGLRGIAALLVVLWHIGGYFQVALAPGHAYLAVDFFFLLSGFVISHAYDARLERGLGLAAFLAVRVTRLYPLILLGVAMGLAAWLLRVWIVADVTVHAIVVAFFFNALLLPTSALTDVRPFAFPISGPLWSLSAEMLVNVAYAASFRLLTFARLLIVLAVGLAALCAVALFRNTLDVGFMWSDCELGVVRAVFPFALGATLQRFVRPGRKTVWGHASTIAVTMILAVPGVTNGIFDIFAVVVLFPLTILLGAKARPLRALDAIWSRLGALSYPLYVTHYPVVAVVSNLAHHLGLRGARLYAAAGACLLLTVVLAAAAGVVDRHVRRRLHLWIKARPTTT